jgi:predicted permease
MFSDLRFAMRTLAKSPGFGMTAVAVLALGIGANTAIFSIVSQVLLSPEGVTHPERIVSLRAKYDKLALRSIPVSIPDFTDVLNSTQFFEAAAIQAGGDFDYTGTGVPERLRGATVTSGWFDTFGARPRLGRVFGPDEDKPNANQVVVLSFGAWKRLFGEDPGVLGRPVELNQKLYRVIGVMGPEFQWPSGMDLWTPLGLAPDQFTENNRFNETFEAEVRMRPGVTLAQASSVVEALNMRVRNSGTRAGAYAKDSAWGMFLVPFTDFVAGETKTPLLVLLGAVGLVLLIACSNIAGLMLARASGRSREIAVRAALGASRWDLIQQTLAESLLLVVTGTVGGLGFAYVAVRGLLLLAPKNSRVMFDVRMDWSVLLFTALAGIAAGILFGVAPAWQSSRLVYYEGLKEGGRSGTASVARQRLRGVLVASEVALALLLLVGTGLFLRSFAALENVNPGFQPAGVASASVTLPRARYADESRQVAFYRTVLGRLSNLPGVAAVAAGTPVPFSGGGGSASFAIEGRPSPPGDPGPHGDIAVVTSDYFATLRVAVLAGRVFTDQDRQDTERVAVIDETLARQYWPDQNPIGQHIRLGSRIPWSTIVGVVAHVKNSDLAGDTVKGKYYFPLYQVPSMRASLIVRTQGDPGALRGAIREAVLAVDGSEPVSNFETMPDAVAESLAPRRFVVTLLGVFAAMALLMAVLGLYGVVSYAVSQRTQEFGIRVALGARRSEILGMVVGQGVRLAGAGAVAGLAASLVLGRLLRSQLFEVSPFDPVIFAGMVVILVGAAMLASYIPARRATQVDPMVALRHE